MRNTGFIIVILTAIAVIVVWALPTPFSALDSAGLLRAIMHNASAYGAIMKTKAVQTTQIMVFGVAFLWLFYRGKRS